MKRGLMTIGLAVLLAAGLAASTDASEISGTANPNNWTQSGNFWTGTGTVVFTGLNNGYPTYQYTENGSLPATLAITLDGFGSIQQTYADMATELASAASNGTDITLVVKPLTQGPPPVAFLVSAN